MNEQAWHSPVVRYCTEEVARQGHDVTKLDGIRRTLWMLGAWEYAITSWEVGQRKPAVADVVALGSRVEIFKNVRGIRTCNVYVGGHMGANPQSVNRLLVDLFESIDQYKDDAVGFYKEFELIHPFEDGNGRTGKILLNWMNGTLYNPVFPPDNLWGRVIRNP